ncbi:MAG: CoxG family protein [Burkholderiaceae bacterium]
MDMQGSRTLAVTQQQAWDALNDPVVLKACIAGCDKVEASGDNQYAIAMALKIGPVAAKFSGKITLSDILPPSSYTLAFEGQGGPAGFGKGNSTVTLTPVNSGSSGSSSGCELAYTVHAQVGGKIAQLGQRLIDGAAKSMADDFFKRFDEEMQRRHPQTATYLIADSAEAARAGGQKSSKVPPWAWVLALALLAAAVWLLS